MQTLVDHIKGPAGDIICGSVGGVALVAVGHPFDTVKVKMVMDKTSLGGTVNAIAKGPSGPLGFYAGAMSPLAGQIFLNSVLFFTWEQSRKQFNGGDSSKPMTLSQNLAAGGVTGLAASFVECPVDLLKTHMQIKNPNRPVVNTLTASFKAILSQGGVTGLYHGITATIIRNIPANACYFGFYELSKSVLIKEGQEATKLKLFLSGGIGGLAYWGLVYPLDFVKTTLQADAILPEKRQWRGMGHVIRATLAAEGVRGFYRGFVPCLARAFPANAACFLAYEQCKAVIASM